MITNDVVLAEIDRVLAKYDDVRHRHGGIATWPDDAIVEVVTLMRAAVERLVSRSSAYLKNTEDILKRYGTHHPTNVAGLLGVLRAMRTDCEAGRMQPLLELIHGEMFSDFLEMSDYLLSEGFKDASAVIAGAVLEEHLRKLCEKNGIPVKRDDEKPKKVELLNTELRKTDVYSIQDQKSVTAWLELRNNAAHGHYDRYTKEQIVLMIQSVRDFLVRNPA